MATSTAPATTPKPVTKKTIITETPSLHRLGNIKEVFEGKVAPQPKVEKSAFEWNDDDENGDKVEADETGLDDNAGANIVVITEQDYLDALEKLIKALNEKSKRSAATALRINNSFFEDNKIILELSKHESLMFDEIRIDILQFFRRELKRPQLQIEFVVVEKASKKAKAFSAKDKLNAMKAKNPAIDKLFDSFNLELDD